MMVVEHGVVIEQGWGSAVVDILIRPHLCQRPMLGLRLLNIPAQHAKVCRDTVQKPLDLVHQHL